MSELKCFLLSQLSEQVSFSITFLEDSPSLEKERACPPPYLFIPVSTTNPYATLSLTYTPKVQNFTQDSHPLREILCLALPTSSVCASYNQFSPNQANLIKLTFVSVLLWGKKPCLHGFLVHTKQKSSCQSFPNIHQTTM